MPVVQFVLCPLYRGKSVLYLVLSYLSPTLRKKKYMNASAPNDKGGSMPAKGKDIYSMRWRSVYI